MTKLRRMDVEPLNEQRWSKIERSLFARLERETVALPGVAQAGTRIVRRWWFATAAAATVASLIAAILLLRPTQPAGVEMPSRITTGADTSHLALPGLAVDVEPDSAVVVGPETPQGMLIVVDRGGIVCEVGQRPSGAPLIVQAGAARVRVLGTRFSVSRQGGSARVAVSHGVVEVNAYGRSVRVGAGEEWPATEVAPSGGSVDTASRPAAVRPTTIAPPPRGAAPAERRAPEPLATAAAPSPAATEEAKPSPSVPQSVFEQAAALERRDPARASQLYGTLESGSDSWAKNALYARAQLEASRGNHGKARQLLERYLQRFPRGENAEDARAVLQRLR
jgi:hypothetical protein